MLEITCVGTKIILNYFKYVNFFPKFDLKIIISVMENKSFMADIFTKMFFFFAVPEQISFRKSFLEVHAIESMILSSRKITSKITRVLRFC